MVYGLLKIIIFKLRLCFLVIMSSIMAMFSYSNHVIDKYSINLY